MSRLKWVSGLAEPCRAGKDRGPFGRKKPLAVPTRGRGSWPSSSSGWLCCSGAHLSRAPDARLEGDGLGSEPCSRCVPGVLTNEGQSQEHILGRTGAPAHPSDSQDWVTALAPPCLSPWAPARLSCQLPSSLDRGAEVSGGQPASGSSPFLSLSPELGPLTVWVPLRGICSSHRHFPLAGCFWSAALTGSEGCLVAKLSRQHPLACS